MHAVIRNYRGGMHSQRTTQYVLVPAGISKRADAEKLKGKAVSWKSPGGKVIKGKISFAHGNKGAVRAIMEKGLPGQALGTKAEIAD